MLAMVVQHRRTREGAGGVLGFGHPSPLAPLPQGERGIMLKAVTWCYNLAMARGKVLPLAAVKRIIE